MSINKKLKWKNLTLQTKINMLNFEQVWKISSAVAIVNFNGK